MEDAICDKCNEVMCEGYIVGNGWAYYCSEECLYSVYTNKEYLEMYEKNEAFWTTLIYLQSKLSCVVVYHFKKRMCLESISESQNIWIS